MTRSLNNLLYRVAGYAIAPSGAMCTMPCVSPRCVTASLHVFSPPSWYVGRARVGSARTRSGRARDCSVVIDRCADKEREREIPLASLAVQSSFAWFARAVNGSVYARAIRVR